MLLISCSKKDAINHYLNKKVTEKELVDNGFYKYSVNITYQNEEDSKDPLIGKVFKNVLYSNLKPQMGKDGKFYPIPFFSGNNTKENSDYVTKELDDRIISYFFVNNILEYKSIFVYEVNKNKKHIADFRTKENIIKYYDSLKIPFKPIVEGKISTTSRTSLFLINNLKTRINYGREKNDIAYDMLTNYVDDKMPYWFIMKDWYSGDSYELSK